GAAPRALPAPRLADRRKIEGCPRGDQTLGMQGVRGDPGPSVRSPWVGPSKLISRLTPPWGILNFPTRFLAGGRAGHPQPFEESEHDLGERVVRGRSAGIVAPRRELLRREGSIRSGRRRRERGRGVRRRGRGRRRVRRSEPDSARKRVAWARFLHFPPRGTPVAPSRTSTPGFTGAAPLP